MPAALALSRIAERTLGKVLGSADKARRLALSLFFRAALGIERIFHFETLDDLGFAVLSGGKRVLSRSRLGGLVRAVTTPAVKTCAVETGGSQFWLRGRLRGRLVLAPPGRFARVFT